MSSSIPEFELRIDSLSFGGGRGVGRHEGLVVFVPGVITGEKVKVRLVERRSSYAVAELIEVLEPSPHRRAAPCPLFLTCGGCQWQHINYDEQLREKERILRQHLRRVSGLQFKVEPSPKEFFYRNRIQLHRSAAGAWGFKVKKSDEVVPINNCWIAESALNDHLPQLTALPPGVRRAELLVDSEGEVKRIEGSRPPELQLFSQVNTEVNQALTAHVVTEVSSFRPQHLLELYSGQGNLTLPLLRADERLKVTAVELSRSCTEVARSRLNEAGLSHRAELFSMSAEGYMKKSDLARFSVVLLDPPRAGCHKAVVSAVLKNPPEAAIYVSCHLASLSRDLGRLMDGGFEVKRIRAFDMFPQTDYLEVVLTMMRSPNRSD